MTRRGPPPRESSRALRRRLDFDRPVDNQLLLDCIDLAEQAPTGGNLGSRRWIIMRDQEVKDRLGELYRDMALGFMSSIAERPRGTGHPQERVASAEYLAEYLAEVPAIVIPTIIGRHDGSGRPGTELTPAGCADQSLGHVTLTSSSWRPRHWAHYPIIASGNRESPRPGSPAR